jgi:Ca2+-dependent lipid-binding protein
LSMQIDAIEASSLRSVQIVGAQDPYAVFMINGNKMLKTKTKVHNNGGSRALWNQRLTLDCDAMHDSLHVIVKDRDMATMGELTPWIRCGDGDERARKTH